jgi:hypothetical protein
MRFILPLWRRDNQRNADINVTHRWDAFSFGAADGCLSDPSKSR